MMLKTKKISKKVDEVVDIICDSCGKSCKDKYEPHNFHFATIEAKWGYGSKKDGDLHKSAICERCYDFIVELMKIKPEIKGYL